MSDYRPNLSNRSGNSLARSGRGDTESDHRDEPQAIHAVEQVGPVLLYLIAFRVANALLVRTFFQPDEFYQSLEPAWQLAFGADSGAWITWARLLPIPCAVNT